MFHKVLVANRGEIALRIGRSLRRMGIGWVAVASEADRFTRGALDADECVLIGAAPASESYLVIDRIIEACLKTGAEAVHPGYGFLSENRQFAERLAKAGITFIGPRPEHLEAFGLKHRARELAEAARVPLLPGTGLLADVEAALEGASGIGYPVMLKSTAGGGGIGMHVCRDATDLAERFTQTERTAKASFGDARLYLERLVEEARHIEVQVFGDGKGTVVGLGERDCSLQRRNQKVIEETPPPGIAAETLAQMRRSAENLCASIAYESAGTVEFIYDVARQSFSFLEVNTRLQVEHPVTETVTGLDLVELMIRQAAGEDVLPALKAAKPQGASIEARIYAENPQAGFRPTAGTLTHVAFPDNARVDGWIETGSEVSAFYDPMLAKVIVSGKDRPEAIAALQAALAETKIFGIETNLSYLKAIAVSEAFTSGKVATHVLQTFQPASRTIEVIAPGVQTSIQELPGRLGFWSVGVPPSGPMDEQSFAAANRIVGNPDTATALEITMRGPTLRFHDDCIIGLAGAPIEASLDGTPVPMHEPIALKARQVLVLGSMREGGQRSYLAVRGGIDAPQYLGSRATFMLGGFGGPATGACKSGDVLTIASTARLKEPRPLEPEEIPPITGQWTIAAIYGPHGAPDFFKGSAIETLFSSSYQVHFNSDRTGVRLIGPKPDWARADGGEAGLHPSNLHDNAYAVGAIDFTGDMPIILGPDGPSLGGFVCPAVVAKQDLWKLGQLRAGDDVRFVPAARPGDPVAGPTVLTLPDTAGSPILGRIDDQEIPVVYRRQGDRNILVEYGDMQLDLGLRMRVHALKKAIEDADLSHRIEMTPGIRSLQIQYCDQELSRANLVDTLKCIESSLPPVSDFSTSSRIVHLPLSWNDPEVALAMRKYQELTYPDAPWCPSNIEFIRRINGLPDEEELRRIIFEASYLVLGLGDVYLGAPVATPVEPRHRLVTTKYNPARIWTPENAVGIGGAYMCVYGMEGPGGYQLFGRTIQMWNRWRRTPYFQDGAPWLLRTFDQVRFFEVDAAELKEARAAFPHGEYPIRIEETTFSHAGYQALLATHADENARFRATRETAFEAERKRWESVPPPPQSQAAIASTIEIPEGCTGCYSEVAGTVWKLLASPGAVVEAGEPILIVESMKMEFAISAPVKGRLHSMLAKGGQSLNAGDLIALVEGQN